MKYTLLDLVQKTLAYIDDFNVQTVGETEESEQVVQIVNTIYNDIIMDFPWPHLHSLGTLSTTSTAHIMKLGTDVLGINWIRYDDRDVDYISPYDMQVKLDGRDTTLSTVDSNGALKDSRPHFWTSEDDFNIIFDSYDGSLASNETKVSIQSSVVALADNTDYPNLPERYHPTLLLGVIADANRVIKGDNVQADRFERKYQKGIANMRRWARRVNRKHNTMPLNYGRKRSVTTRRVEVIDGGA